MIFGYAVCYRETKKGNYLEHAEKTLNFVKNNPNLTQDLIPYWDYDASTKENTPRDASAAAILASALYELKDFAASKKEEYQQMADKIMNSLSSDTYLAKVGTNKEFLLNHSVGNLPGDSEIDVPLNYADYYYLAALSRKKNKYSSL